MKKSYSVRFRVLFGLLGMTILLFVACKPEIEITYSIGDIGPAGGYIFYENATYETDGWRYLESAPAGWSGSPGDPTAIFAFYWDGTAFQTAGTAAGVGSGEDNTTAIIGNVMYTNNLHNTIASAYAAKLCADLVLTHAGHDYDDWFMPSKDELDLMFQNLKQQNLGGFENFSYWCSTEFSADSAWNQYFVTGTTNSSALRSNTFRVRPVRAF